MRDAGWGRRARVGDNLVHRAPVVHGWPRGRAGGPVTAPTGLVPLAHAPPTLGGAWGRPRSNCGMRSPSLPGGVSDGSDEIAMRLDGGSERGRGRARGVGDGGPHLPMSRCSDGAISLRREDLRRGRGRRWTVWMPGGERGRQELTCPPAPIILRVLLPSGIPAPWRAARPEGFRRSRRKAGRKRGRGSGPRCRKASLAGPHGGAAGCLFVVRAPRPTGTGLT